MAAPLSFAALVTAVCNASASRASSESAASPALPSASARASCAGFDVGNIWGKVNAVVDNLLATGRIKIGDVTAETGDARVTNLAAGVSPPKKA
jgi:hypothetical protein